MVEGGCCCLYVRIFHFLKDEQEIGIDVGEPVSLGIGSNSPIHSWVLFT